MTAEVIGETIPERLEISLDGKVVISAAVSELSEAYEGALESALRTDPELVAATDRVRLHRDSESQRPLSELRELYGSVRAKKLKAKS